MLKNAQPRGIIAPGTFKSFKFILSPHFSNQKKKKKKKKKINLLLQWPDTIGHDWGTWTWNINLFMLNGMGAKFNRNFLQPAHKQASAQVHNNNSNNKA